MGKKRHLASARELTLALEDTLSRPIFKLGRRTHERRSSFWLEELTIDFGSGKTQTVMFKDLSWNNLSAEGRRAKPSFLYDPLREIEVYRLVLGQQQWGSPVYLGSIADTARARFWLFSEKVDGRELYQVGDVQQWESVARWLARFHRCKQNFETGLARELKQHLIRCEKEYYWRWMVRAESFNTSHTDRSATAFQGLMRQYDQVVDVLLSLPTSLTHGDFYASNVLINRPHEQERICPVDWEMAAIGPSLMDLAALISGRWSRPHQQQIAEAYYAENAALYPGPFPKFWRLCQFCRLHLAIQWLGWSDDWVPPADHQHDWFAEALTLAEELGL